MFRNIIISTILSFYFIVDIITKRNLLVKRGDENHKLNDRPNGILLRGSMRRSAKAGSIPRNRQRETAEPGKFSGNHEGRAA